MNICTCREMRRAEAAALADGSLSSDELMDDAIAAATSLLVQDPVYKNAAERYQQVIVYAGKGKNAGDAIGIARSMGFSHIKLRCATDLHDLAPESRRQLDLVPPGIIDICRQTPAPAAGTLLLDGLLGSGAYGKLRPEYAALTREMNALRTAHPHTSLIAIDTPTGLNADSGEADADATRADATLAIGCVKPGMLADGAEDYVGRLLCVPLEKAPAPRSCDQALDESALAWLPHRSYSCYKNRAGRVRIIAGSIGYTGAAEMCAEAALAAGAGLVELYCLHEIYTILAARVSPEVIVRPVSSYAEASGAGADALLIGPGLGRPSDANRQALQRIAETAPCPLVLDADGLNLAAEYGWRLPEHAILTPHPGEMRRLFPAAAELSRRACATAFAQQHPCTLLLKGARSIITDGSRLYYNTTGGPFMANGGQGDVLAGVIAALAAQGIPSLRAAALGAYLCGRAAAHAWATRGFPLSIRATQLLPYLTAVS